MIRSMTGYGRGESRGPEGRFVVEIKSVNHRFCEVVMRLPRGYAPLEDRMRQQIQAVATRGRLDVFLTAEEAALGRKRVVVDKDLALAYYNGLRDLLSAVGLPEDVDAAVLTRVPELLRLEEVPEDPEAVWPAVSEALAQALANLVLMREREGAALSGDLEARCRLIRDRVGQIGRRAQLVVEEYRDRLSARLADLVPPGAIDPARLAMEVALFAERSDITEELKRLESHLDQLQRTVREDEAVGRKLEFILQEINRETNTVGSKAGDIEIARAVVEIKSELEKIREQAQNIE